MVYEHTVVTLVTIVDLPRAMDGMYRNAVTSFWILSQR
jgi:hypothetical protein